MKFHAIFHMIYLLTFLTHLKHTNHWNYHIMLLFILLHRIINGNDKWVINAPTFGKRKPCRNHFGHMELNACDLPVEISLIREEEKNIAKSCAQIHTNHSLVATMLSHQNVLGINSTCNASQIYHI